MADAEAQAVIVCRAEFCLNVFQAVVSTVAAAEFEFDPSAGNVEFVVDDEDFFGFDFIKLRKGGNCLSGTVHERGRLEQPDIAVGQGSTGDFAEEFFSSLNEAFHFHASSSRNQKPALWRVCSYSLPGLPKPTTILIVFDMIFSVFLPNAV